jgi:DNA-binding CsgD family transcriptional regulator/predicted nucleic acid-binding protein
VLLGRDRERREIGLAVGRARSGTSATLALVGEPGIGKTALLEHAAACSEGMQLLRARGIESETQVPFASLLELLRPALAALDQIPGPQAIALEGALALRPAQAQDRFAIGAATLSLLATYAEKRPVAVLIDDAQWLDQPSAQALMFAFRRLVADPIAVLVAVREGEPSLLDGADLPLLRIGGLSAEEAAILLDGVPPDAARRLHTATAGNPLALLELASDGNDELTLAPEGAPVLVGTRIARAFLQRAETLDEEAQRALVLAATSDTGALATLERAAAQLGIELATLAAAEAAELITIRGGTIEFRHPLVRSAVYANASGEQRRQAHRALAAALPDRDVDRRAWHLAAAAVGTDEAASSALEQAAARAHGRSAYATASSGFERAARLTADGARQARLFFQAADAGWNAGLAERAMELLEEARIASEDLARLIEIERLAGHIVARRGPVMGGHAILCAAAEHADPESAVAMLAEAASACFYAGEPAQMLATAERARSRLPAKPSIRARFLAAAAYGMALTLGGDAAKGAEELHAAVALAEGEAELRDDPDLLSWLTMGPIFLREAGSGRPLVEHVLAAARERTALGVLPFVLGLIARDESTSDRWAVAEATYREAIDVARETDQETDLVFGLAGLAWLDARRGREAECRAALSEAQVISTRLGTQMFQVWATAALGELELGLGNASQAVEHFEDQRRLAAERGITDVDLFPGAELVEAYLRLNRTDDAARVAADYLGAARAKGQPWSLARALRAQGLVAAEGEFSQWFDESLARQAETPDVFEGARTQLAYGERLRRGRSRVLAREQLRSALTTFETLGARSWAASARSELEASGETLRRGDVTARDELTPQELQIALLLAAGRTTREAAAAVFLSPKTIEYHLRHVYQKLDVHSREELARALGERAAVARPSAVPESL